MSKFIDLTKTVEVPIAPEVKRKSTRLVSASRLEDDITIYKSNDSVRELRGFLKEHRYFACDDSVFEELKATLIWVKRAKNFRIHGPEDLGVAQEALNEIQAYRDRAVEINLESLANHSRLTRTASACYNQLLLHDSFLSKSESVKNRIVQLVLGGKFTASLAQWDMLVESAKLVVKNCRDSFDIVHTQADIAKQQWFTKANVGQVSKP